MTNTANQFAARVVLDGIQEPSARCALLAALIEWADSEEGQDARAGLAHSGEPSPVTVNDVIALLDEEYAAAVQVVVDNALN